MGGHVHNSDTSTLASPLTPRLHSHRMQSHPRPAPLSLDVQVDLQSSLEQRSKCNRRGEMAMHWPPYQRRDRPPSSSSVPAHRFYETPILHHQPTYHKTATNKHHHPKASSSHSNARNNLGRLPAPHQPQPPRPLAPAPAPAGHAKAQHHGDPGHDGRPAVCRDRAGAAADQGRYGCAGGDASGGGGVGDGPRGRGGRGGGLGGCGGDLCGCSEGTWGEERL
ncbi:hypothetical protein EDC01DRAFT_762969, partial [Geopyxis carbonaria]